MDVSILFPIIIGGCIGLVIGYLIAAPQVGHKTAITRLVGFCGTLGLLLIIIYILKLISWQLQLQVLSIGVILFGVLLGVQIIVIYPRCKGQAGTLILNLGQHPLIPKLSMIICASFFIGEGFYFLFIKSSSPSLLGYHKLFLYSSGFLFLSIGAFLFLMSITKREIKTNGILCFPVLIKWEKIISYQWTGRRKNCLTLQARNPIPFNRKVVILISPAQKDEVDNILDAHVSRRTS